MTGERQYVAINREAPGALDAACPDCGAVVYDTALHDEFHRWVYPRTVHGLPHEATR
jgi:hypothetical protein